MISTGHYFPVKALNNLYINRWQTTLYLYRFGILTMDGLCTGRLLRQALYTLTKLATSRLITV